MANLPNKTERGMRNGGVPALLSLAFGEGFEDMPGALFALVGRQHGCEIAEGHGGATENADGGVQIECRAVCLSKAGCRSLVGANNAYRVEALHEQEQSLRVKRDIPFVRRIRGMQRGIPARIRVSVSEARKRFRQRVARLVVERLLA